eukprot:2958339-Karenia_brevis.AAC.1
MVMMTMMMMMMIPYPFWLKLKACQQLLPHTTLLQQSPCSTTPCQTSVVIVCSHHALLSGKFHLP